MLLIICVVYFCAVWFIFVVRLCCQRLARRDCRVDGVLVAHLVGHHPDLAACLLLSPSLVTANDHYHY